MEGAFFGIPEGEEVAEAEGEAGDVLGEVAADGAAFGETLTFAIEDLEFEDELAGGTPFAVDKPDFVDALDGKLGEDGGAVDEEEASAVCVGSSPHDGGGKHGDLDEQVDDGEDDAVDHTGGEAGAPVGIGGVTREEGGGFAEFGEVARFAVGANFDAAPGRKQTFGVEVGAAGTGTTGDGGSSRGQEFGKRGPASGTFAPAEGEGAQRAGEGEIPELLLFERPLLGTVLPRVPGQTLSIARVILNPVSLKSRIPYRTMYFFPILFAVLDSESDRALAERLKAREPEALRELYDKYGRLAYALIFRVVRNAGVAEDLTQETFLRVWNRMAGFDHQKGAIGPWVLTVARNRAIDYLRSVDGRMTQNAIELTGTESPALFVDMESTILNAERAKQLKEAFRKLNENQRTVIELAYFEGLSQTEMAEKMRQPLGTVKTWVRTALRTLREELEEPALV